MQWSVPTGRRNFLASLASLIGCAASSLVRGQESAVPGVLRRLRESIEQAPLEMRLEAMSADECIAFQDRFRSRLKDALGAYNPPKAWKTTLVRTWQLAGFRRDELLLEAEGHPPLPVYLLVPERAKSERRPGVLALHGHGAYGHHPIAGRDDLPDVAKAIASANYDYGRQLALRGYLVACPCFTPFGDRLGGKEAFGQRDPCDDVFLRQLALGRVLMGENLRDALWALNLLVQHEQVDQERLACVGLSLGGRMTMLTAAMEPRIRVAAISGALNVMQERLSQPYSCGAQIIPGMLQYGDVPEIGGLIAPRHAVWEVGSRDKLIKPAWASEALARMQQAYRALGAEARLIVDRFEGGHQWHGSVAYDVLAKVLS